MAEHGDVAQRGRAIRDRDRHPGEDLAAVMPRRPCFSQTNAGDEADVRPIPSARSPNTRAPTWATLQSSPGRI
jgi:hypothetical protein